MTARNACPKCLFLVRDPNALTYQRLIWPARRAASTGSVRVELVAEPRATYLEGADALVMRGHANRHEYDLLQAAQANGIRVILDVCGWIDAPPYDPRYFELEALRPYSELAMSLADVVLCPSQRLADAVSDYSPNVSVLPTFTPHLGISQANRASLRDRLGVPSDACVVCWPGRQADLHSLRMVGGVTELVLCEQLNLWFLSFTDVSDAMYVPEDRRLTLSPLPYLQYLEALDVADILLVPHEASLFNTLRCPSAEHDAVIKGLRAVVSSPSEQSAPEGMRRVDLGDISGWRNAIERSCAELAQHGRLKPIKGAASKDGLGLLPHLLGDGGPAA